MIGDIVQPALMIGDRVDAQRDDFGVTLLEVGLQARHVAELGRADGREVLRMREENGPVIADPIVEVDFAFRGVGAEVWGLGVDPQ
jgi:hypothetical protein